MIFFFVYFIRILVHILSIQSYRLGNCIGFGEGSYFSVV